MEALLHTVRKNIIDILDKANVSASAYEADIIVEHFAKATKLDLLTDRNLKIDETVAKKIYEAAEKRAKGTPLQHIIGFTEFMGLTFKVNENVLCPRPDTEILVQEAIDAAKKLLEADRENLKILDMCTGSGAIAVSLSHFIKNAEIYAADISEEALEVAKQNAADNNCKITFYQGNFFDALNGTEAEKFDIIVSNPPYIPTADIDGLANEVRLHEPMLALDGGTDGLVAYRKLTEDSPKHLNKGGYLIFEVGINQSNDVAMLMENDFEDIKIVRDYGGIERVVYGKLIKK